MIFDWWKLELIQTPESELDLELESELELEQT